MVEPNISDNSFVGHQVKKYFLKVRDVTVKLLVINLTPLHYVSLPSVLYTKYLTTFWYKKKTF